MTQHLREWNRKLEKGEIDLNDENMRLICDIDDGRLSTSAVNVRYYIDPQTGQPHIHNHDVTEAEVEDIISMPGEDRPGREGSRVAVGQTQAGRYLRVVYVPDPEPNSVFVVTAFELEGRPLTAYRRRRRRK